MFRLGAKLRIFAFLMVVLLLASSCSLKLSQLGKEDEPDPITLLRREVRQLRADHRVSLFDMQKELNGQIERLRADLKKEAAEKEKERFALRKRDADFAEQIAEIEMQVRILGGSFEEEVNRVKEFSDQKNNEAFQALAEIRSLLAEKEKQETLAKQNFQNKITGQLKQEGEVKKSLQEQIDSMRTFNETLQQSSNDQIKALKAVSDQVSELIEKVLPAVNTLGERVDRHDAKLKSLEGGIDAAGLNQKLNDLTKAVEVQRKSLEMLGNTITAQIDKHQTLLEQTSNRVRVLETKESSVKK